MIKWICSKRGQNAIASIFIYATIVVVFIFLFTNYEKRSATVSEQQQTIQQLTSQLDSSRNELRFITNKSDSLIEGLDRVMELAGRTDSLINGIRTTVEESGATVTQLINRQLRINRLVGELSIEYSRVKEQLRKVNDSYGIHARECEEVKQTE